MCSQICQGAGEGTGLAFGELVGSDKGTLRRSTGALHSDTYHDTSPFLSLHYFLFFLILATPLETLDLA